MNPGTYYKFVLFPSLQGAKDLIQHLLIVDKKRRYNAIDTLCHPWILCGGDMSSVDPVKLSELTKVTRKDYEMQASLNRESYLKMKEKRANNGWAMCPLGLC